MPPAPPPNLPQSPHFVATPPRAARPFEPNPPSTFSATQRSLQARNKPYNITGKKRPEDEAKEYETRLKREQAAKILDSTELLIWYSNARNESIPQTRQHYQNIVWGFPDDGEDVVWREEWEVDQGVGMGVASPRSAKGKEKERVLSSGKRRVSGRSVQGG